MMRFITDYLYDELLEAVIDLGGKKYNGDQIWQWIYRNGIDNFDDMSNVPQKLKERLKHSFSINPIKTSIKKESNDGTKKYLLTLFDGAEIESVLIPEEKRVTLCVSSQVGCKFNCSFCATGKLGFTRNLTTSEIVAQILYIQKESGQRITNIVYMGMGEPLDNYDNVIKSATILSHDKGTAIGSRKITISSFGLVPAIRRFIDEDIRFRLAISLHSAFDGKRSYLMPANKRYPLGELMPLLREYAEKSKRKVVFEYIMLKDENDTLEDAQKIKKLLSSLPSKLNLIRYHENKLSKFKYSGDETKNAFYNYFRGSSFPVMFRVSRGEDIDAACGQLKANS